MKNSSLNYALWLLSKRDRSIEEVRIKLKNKRYPLPEIEETVDFLIDKTFLDDERFANNFVRSQIALRPQGKYQLKIKLKRKFVSEENIIKALEQIEGNEERLAEEAIEKWLRKNENKDKKYEKLYRHLVSRGFDWDTVTKIIGKYKD